MTIDATFHKANALIIDSNANARSLITAQLRELGCGYVRSVARVKEARIVLENAPYDLVLCDYHFDGHDESGQDLLDELRRENMLPYSTVFMMITGEATAQQGTDACEVMLEGEGPWPFPDGDADLTIVRTPGHTRDHCVLLSAAHRALFSGDHLSGAEEEEVAWKLDGRLFVYTEFNWWSVPEQLRSVEKLLAYDWLHVLPGHGAPARLAGSVSIPAPFRPRPSARQ